MKTLGCKLIFAFSGTRIELVKFEPPSFLHTALGSTSTDISGQSHDATAEYDRKTYYVIVCNIYDGAGVVMVGTNSERFTLRLKPHDVLVKGSGCGRR